MHTPDPSVRPARPRQIVYRLLARFGCLLVGLCALGWWVKKRGNRSGIPGDRWLAQVIHHPMSHLSHRFVHGLSHSGAPTTVMPLNGLVLVLLLGRRHTALARHWALITGGAWSLHLATKWLVDRRRPPTWRLKHSTPSFPSGHAMHSLAFVLALHTALRRSAWQRPLLILGCGWVAAVGAARIALAEHHPSDILGAWLAALLWAREVEIIEQPQRPQQPTPVQEGDV